MNKITATFNEEIRQQLLNADDSADKMTAIAALVGVNFYRVQTWLKRNSPALRQYEVILATSRVLNIPVEEIITVEN